MKMRAILDDRSEAYYEHQVAIAAGSVRIRSLVPGTASKPLLWMYRLLSDNRKQRVREEVP